VVTQWGADKRSKVDVVGLKNNVPAVLIEIELKKDNPVENVVKIWHWRTKKRNEGSILFVQAFSAHYLNPSDKNSTPSKAKQYRRAVFIGRQMAKDRLLRIRYKDLPIYGTTRNRKRKQFKPRMRRGIRVGEGGGAMLRAADELAKDIEILLRRRRR
jgi:hypothetical protein